MTRRRPCSCQGSGTEPSGTVHAGLAERLPCGDCGPDCPDDCGCMAARDEVLQASVSQVLEGLVPDLAAEVRRLRAERDRARDTAAAAEAELARVADLHSEGSGGADAPVPWCLECSTPWPCPTTRAITGDGHSGTGEAENGPQSGMQPVFVAEVRKVTSEDGGE